MRDSVFVDTNVFVYAYTVKEPKKREMAIGLLKEHLTGTSIFVSTQILNEFYSAMSKNKVTHKEILRYVSEIIRCANVTSVSLSTVESCLKLKERYEYSYWDSLLLAAALDCGCNVLYSEDMQHGQVIDKRLTILNPFEG
ncbi:MAG: PIN domain-containing protein [Oscillospiraceae bacterium]|nr:PIN domain-containing protein [Oscillospiraceae bacterium]